MSVHRDRPGNRLSLFLPFPLIPAFRFHSFVPRQGRCGRPLSVYTVLVRHLARRNGRQPFHPCQHNFQRELIICADIVRQHGGSLAVKSKVGEDSVFTVMLPMKRRTQE